MPTEKEWQKGKIQPPNNPSMQKDSSVSYIKRSS